LAKEGNRDPKDKTKSHFSEQSFEEVKHCVNYYRYVRGLNQIKSVKKCDLISTEKLFNELLDEKRERKKVQSIHTIWLGK
jgi:hypothetical protein